MTFEVVDRPHRSSTIPEDFLNALLDTLDNGKALRIKLDDKASFINWQAAVRARVRTEGYRLRAKHNKVTNVVTCWVERFADDRDVQDVDTGTDHTTS